MAAHRLTALLFLAQVSLVLLFGVLRASAQTTTVTATDVPIPIAGHVVSAANLRAVSTTRSRIVGRLSAGTRVEIIGQEQGERLSIGTTTSDLWYHVKVEEENGELEGFLWSGLVATDAVLSEATPPASPEATLHPESVTAANNTDYDARFTTWDEAEIMNGHTLTVGVIGEGDMSIFGGNAVHFHRDRFLRLGMLNDLDHDILLEFILTDNMERTRIEEQQLYHGRRGYIFDDWMGTEMINHRSGYNDGGTRVVRVWLNPPLAAGFGNPLVTLNNLLASFLDSSENGGNPWNIFISDKWDLRHNSNAFITFGR